VRLGLALEIVSPLALKPVNLRIRNSRSLLMPYGQAQVAISRLYLVLSPAHGLLLLSLLYVLLSFLVDRNLVQIDI